VAVFLRLMSYGLTLFVFAAVWCCGLLIPINATVRFFLGGGGGGAASP
jgi:hypothetical protein